MKKDPRFQPVDAAVTPRFAGIATFMRTQRHDVSPDLDIALVGVPFDIGVNYRAGARQGPCRRARGLAPHPPRAQCLRHRAL